MTNLRLRGGTAIKKALSFSSKGFTKPTGKCSRRDNCPSHAARILPFYDLIAGKAFIGDGGLMFLQLLL